MVPSGHQVTLSHGGQQATVVEVGGGLREYAVDGVPVIDGYLATEMCRDGRGQVLAPWPNRLAGGRYRFGGAELQTPLSEPERGNAIHGLVSWVSWQVVEQSSERVTMGTVVRPQPGYPFALMLSVEYSLGNGGLKVATTASNIGDEPLPFGLGFHPYLTVGTAVIDDAWLSIPADRVLEADDSGIPTGKSQGVGGTKFDFRSPSHLGDRQLDHCFADLRRDDDGLARATLTAPDGSAFPVLWAGDGFRYLMVFTGDTLGPAGRRRSVALEPMTCPPDAFNSGVDLTVLEPESSFSAAWGITAA